MAGARQRAKTRGRTAPGSFLSCAALLVLVTSVMAAEPAMVEVELHPPGDVLVAEGERGPVLEGIVRRLTPYELVLEFSPNDEGVFTSTLTCRGRAVRTVGGVSFDEAPRVGDGGPHFVLIRPVAVATVGRDGSTSAGEAGEVILEGDVSLAPFGLRVRGWPSQALRAADPGDAEVHAHRWIEVGGVDGQEVEAWLIDRARSGALRWPLTHGFGTSWGITSRNLSMAWAADPFLALLLFAVLSAVAVFAATLAVHRLAPRSKAEDAPAPRWWRSAVLSVASPAILWVATMLAAAPWTPGVLVNYALLALALGLGALLHRGLHGGAFGRALIGTVAASVVSIGSWRLAESILFPIFEELAR